MPNHGDGPIPARVMIVGEAWGADEEREGRPFVGASGMELNKMLHEAGIMRSECFVTNLVNFRPPNNDLSNWIAKAKKDVTATHRPLRDKMVLPIVHDGYKKLLTEIAAVQPKVIIAFGNTSMWALTGLWGITKWRGSNLEFKEIPLLPTYHPAAILRQWDWRAVAISDLRRAKRILVEGPPTPPAYRFQVRPSFEAVRAVLLNLLHRADETADPIWIDFDIETDRYTQQIKCVGISWSLLEALCIPFVSQNQDYWNEDEETWLVFNLYKLLTHPKVWVRWQNGLFDAQIVYRHWHFIPNGKQDTMISQHSLFAALPKALHFQASMYAQFYIFWKEEGKTI